MRPRRPSGAGARASRGGPEASGAQPEGAGDRAARPARLLAGRAAPEARPRGSRRRRGVRDRSGPGGEPLEPLEPLEALLDELAQLGYLSDERYARSVVARKSASHSRRAIAEELKARGVAGDAVQSAIDASEADDAVTLRALWQRRFGVAPRDDREKARQVRFLQSRGFTLSAILRFLRELPAERRRALRTDLQRPDFYGKSAVPR